MNNSRRKSISDVIRSLEDISSQIEQILSEEQEYFDNMPEAFQNSERGERAGFSIEALESALSDLSTVTDSLEDAKG